MNTLAAERQWRRKNKSKFTEAKIAGSSPASGRSLISLSVTASMAPNHDGAGRDRSEPKGKFL